ncbi:hypothetical protein B0E33_10225 [Roseibium algicola]|uniref:Uncharacterized protein n=1 Tax=Roseibium algicola TaxID=2857014 RepID=A0ABN4WQA3_9HYPH|nr:hypothetical protein B0E33_10225 [Roseibium aggregatum]|tara:strand:+ start:305 stop:499 length:195 start_codon:yes stop_codon:yes gene_type:complete
MDLANIDAENKCTVDAVKMCRSQTERPSGGQLVTCTPTWCCNMMFRLSRIAFATAAFKRPTEMF